MAKAAPLCPLRSVRLRSCLIALPGTPTAVLGGGAERGHLWLGSDHGGSILSLSATRCPLFEKKVPSTPALPRAFFVFLLSPHTVNRSKWLSWVRPAGPPGTKHAWSNVVSIARGAGLFASVLWRLFAPRCVRGAGLGSPSPVLPSLLTPGWCWPRRLCCRVALLLSFLAEFVYSCYCFCKHFVESASKAAWAWRFLCVKLLSHRLSSSGGNRPTQAVSVFLRERDC